VTFNLGDGVTIFEGIDSSTGDGLALTVQVIEDQVLVCLAVSPSSQNAVTVCDASLGVVELPLLTTIDFSERRFVLAFVDSGEALGSAIRLKLADGMLLTPLQEFGPAVPGWAVAALLPDQYGIIELFVKGEVVAAI
jgi:hypothetical protein